VNTPLAVMYHNVEKSSTLDDFIHDRATKLEEFHHHIISCRVYVDKPQEHQHSGSPFVVRLDIRIPHDHEIVVKSRPGNGSGRDSIFKVVNDTFEAAYRKMKKTREIQRQAVKSHPEQEANGIVAKVLKARGFGFLEAADGRKIYFHKNSVSQGRFAELRSGDAVNFTEELGRKGPQASTVRLVYRTHL
jgi:cold shock CspA family protein/ribosome-associated translation inhibitor RaiA